MSESTSTLIEREVKILHDLASQALERAAGEAKLTGELAAKGAKLEADYNAARLDRRQKSASILRQIEQARDAELARIKADAAAERTRIQAESDAAAKTYKQRYASEIAKAEKKLEETRWESSAIFDSGRESAKKSLEIAMRALDADLQTRTQVEDEATHLLDVSKKYIKPDAPAAPALELPAPGEDPRQALKESIQAVDAHVAAWTKLQSIKVLRIDALIMLFVFLAAALVVGGGFILGNWMVAGIAGGVVAAVLTVGVYFLMLGVAKKSVTAIAVPLRAELEHVAALADASKAFVIEENRRQVELITTRRDNEVKKAEAEFAQRKANSDARREAERVRVEETYPAQIVEVLKLAESTTKQVSEAAAKKLAEAKEMGESRLKQLDDSYAAESKAHAEAVAKFWYELSTKWADDSKRVMDEVAAIHAENDRLFPEWKDGWKGWKPPEEIPPAIRFGDVEIFPGKMPKGTPTDERLKAVAPTDFTLPALIDFTQKGSLLLRAGDGGRDEAVSLLQAVMLRMLTAIPPSKVRFTILDPVGLGRGFASFMHLTDYDEIMINQRIWTDSAQIDQRLKDLTDHMENVILTYLRNDFPTIEAYNAQAGEVSEPYRVLVIANFPHGFTENAMRSLQSIISSGSRCGVLTLISIDARSPMPYGFNLKDFEAHALNMIWKDDKFVWKDPEFEPLKLTLDKPPAGDGSTAILHDVGKISKDARRVEVPFEVIAPTEAKWWTTDSRAGIDVPLGRAGATKLQYMRLGKGTSQHVLIAGKTGSGKSTLLHAIITNVALRYSPKEVELYLIDFKKGVEFKTYAAHKLPHARIIAVESEREFGLSVLQRLDAELKLRGEKYRAAGAQDVASYRNNRPDEDMPRMLLLVDEFQEFFIEDDKLAQEASLLLDRLVRQGRAFGIHVQLGSQTLAGAFSLARSTLGQMAVRIALQCSESDAHLILSEENSAARLLTRPGEAIYNDANGMVEGNHIFQIVWLGDARREVYLKGLAKLAEERGMEPKTKMIVFEGNTPALIETNLALKAMLEADDWIATPRSVPAWMGDAIAIKDPTEALFQPQSGSHALLVGQQPESAVGVLTASIISLAAQHEPYTPRGAKFIMFDGTPADSPFVGQLTRLADVFPHPFVLGNHRTLPTLMNEIAVEVERRRMDDPPEQPAIYLIINDLNRFRDLRKSEDDFGGFGGFGGEAKPPNPSKQFVTILREGPMVNVHVLVWCDTMANLNRAFDRQSLGEFEMRILFQMSAGDSSQLIDSPAAGRLGENRALFFSEEQGRLEKFRPYNPPSDEQLAQIKAQFAVKPVVVPPEPEPVPEPQPEPVASTPDPMRDDGLSSMSSSSRPYDDDIMDGTAGHGKGNGNGNGRGDSDDPVYNDPFGATP